MTKCTNENPTWTILHLMSQQTEGASVLLRKSLLDVWVASETPPPSPHTLSNPKTNWTVCLTIFATFWNQQNDIHTHFTSWLVSCAEEHVLLSNYMCHFSCEHASGTPWIRDTGWNVSLSPYSNDEPLLTPLWQPVFLSAFECGRLDQVYTLISYVVGQLCVWTTSFPGQPCPKEGIQPSMWPKYLSGVPKHSKQRIQPFPPLGHFHLNM